MAKQHTPPIVGCSSCGSVSMTKSDYWINQKNYHWMIGDFDTGIDSRGVPGPKGDPGILQFNSVEELRNISESDLNKLKNGIYKAVQLNGYYYADDTPAPILYFLSETSDPDDGGSVIEVGGVKLEHEFTDGFYLEYFGCMPNIDSIDYTNKFDKAIGYLNRTDKATLYLSRGKYYSNGFKLASNRSIIGLGQGVSSIGVSDYTEESLEYFIDLTDSSESLLIDFAVHGGYKKVGLKGVLITSTSSSGDKSNRRLKLNNLYIYNFLSDAITALYGSGSWMFTVENCEIANNNGWGIYNTTTDNAFLENMILGNDQGGIRNLGGNTRFRGGKILFNGKSNINGAGIYDSSHRSQYIGVECQENYYDGIILQGTRNLKIEAISHMNNVAARPLGLSGGLGITDNISYGLKVLSAYDCDINVGTMGSISSTHDTQTPYFINNSEVFRNQIKIQNSDIDTHVGVNNADITLNEVSITSIVSNRVFTTAGETDWKSAIHFKCDEVEGTYRCNIKGKIFFNFGLGVGSEIRTSDFIINMNFINAGTIVDTISLKAEYIPTDSIRVVKIGINDYQLQIKRACIELESYSYTTNTLSYVKINKSTAEDGLVVVDYTNYSSYPTYISSLNIRGLEEGNFLKAGTNGSVTHGEISPYDIGLDNTSTLPTRVGSNISQINFGQSPSNFTIAQRTDTGALKGNNPLVDDDLVNLRVLKGTLDNSLTASETSASLNTKYPSAIVGYRYLSITNLVKYTKISSTQWIKEDLIIV